MQSWLLTAETWAWPNFFFKKRRQFCMAILAIAWLHALINYASNLLNYRLHCQYHKLLGKCWSSGFDSVDLFSKVAACRHRKYQAPEGSMYLVSCFICTSSILFPLQTFGLLTRLQCRVKVQKESEVLKGEQTGFLLTLARITWLFCSVRSLPRSPRF